MNIIRFFRLLLLSALLTDRVSAQELAIWPGDATNNGVVSNIDLLSIGLAYNFTGPSRQDSFLQNIFNFEAQDALPWNFLLPSGLNMAFSDGDGDGIVNYEDVVAIYANYGNRKPDTSQVEEDEFMRGIPGIDPTLGFAKDDLPNVLGGGQDFSLSIVLGDEALPAEDLYGLAFSIFTDKPVINFNESAFDFTEESWANHDDDRIFMYKPVSSNRADVAWTRTDRNQRDGFGRIGVADFIIIVDVVGYSSAKVWIDSIRMIDKFGNIKAVAGDTLYLNINPNAILPQQEPSADVHFKAGPNPVTEHLYLQADIPMQHLNLFNATGQTVLQKKLPNLNLYDLHLPDLPAGCYLLSVETERGRLFKRIQIVPTHF